MKSFSKKKIIITVVAFFAALVFQNIAFNNVVGTDVSFTLFDFLAPALGGIIGGSLGVVAVFVASFTNVLLTGANFTTAVILRLFPTLFAVYYFSLDPAKKKGKILILAPILSMIAFWMHPNGRAAWYYALYWLIPVVGYFKRDWLFVRSLSATFTAHAVGGASFIWALDIPASIWNSIIPLVAVERILFALGISLTYILAVNASQLFNKKVNIKDVVTLDPKYIFNKR